MPAYNAEKFIDQTIESVLSQTFKNWELIIINDGSSDQTKQVAEKYHLKDERIKVINQVNKKQGGARNAGLTVAKGEWIAFLDADDLWESTKLNKQLAVTALFPDVDLIYSNGYFFSDNNLIDTKHYVAPVGEFTSSKMYKMLFEKNQIPVLSVILKRRMLEDVGLQDEREIIQGCEDFDYWIRIAKGDNVFYGMEDRLFYYRKHNNNMSSNNVTMSLAGTAVLIKNYEKERFTMTETREIFKPLINYLVFILLNDSNRKDVIYLLRQASNKLPITYFKVNSLLFEWFGSYSILPMRIFNKVDDLVFRLFGDFKRHN